jgi:nucleotide-binding universal stress UspA family protein
MVAVSDRPSPAPTEPARESAADPLEPPPTDVAPLVVGFDGSTSATAALAWAGATGMPVVVVRVVERRQAQAHRPDPGDDKTALVLGDHAPAAVASLAGCPWRAELVEAFSPGAALAAVARRHGATAIVVGSHGHALARSILGREPHRLLTEADVPVVVIPPQAAARLLGSGRARRLGQL